MAEYPGAARAAVSPNRYPRQGRVQLFIVHHYAGTQGPESAWKRFNAPNDRSVSPNYQVNADGSVFEVVPPDRFRAWTTGMIDHQAVTCETQNTSGAPTWGISRESHEAIAHLVAWASKRYGFPIQRGAVAAGNVVTAPGVVGHRETPAGRQTSTACPGPSMDLDWIVNRARQIAGGTPAGGSAPPKRKKKKNMIHAAYRADNGTFAVQYRPRGRLTLLPIGTGATEMAGMSAAQGVEMAQISNGQLQALIDLYGIAPYAAADTAHLPFLIVRGDPNGTVYTFAGGKLEPIYDSKTLETIEYRAESVTWSAKEIRLRLEHA